ncbi:MAG TPA: RidA family protein [Dehalococcoidia bacterium]|jgi:enamine deaminase RidA (YjgF/YER057c/UK114 family)|nr:RidA family protein [Dehalococcoidia bacterium]
MALEHIAPEGIHEAQGYTHVVKMGAGALAFISGQVGIDADGQLAGSDLESQARQAFANLGAAISAVGATPSDVAKITTYVVNYSPEARPALSAARDGFFGGDPPASTLVGVQALATSVLLVEVEAIVALD